MSSSKNMQYLYKDHLYGGYFLLDEEYDYDELYCEQCGDSDMLLAEVEENSASDIFSAIFEDTVDIDDDDEDEYNEVLGDTLDLIYISENEALGLWNKLVTKQLKMKENNYE